MHISKEPYRKQSSWDSNKCTQDWIQVLKSAVQPAASQHWPHACQLHEGSTLLAFFCGPLGIGHAPGLLSMCIRMNIPECPQSLAWSISNSHSLLSSHHLAWWELCLLASGFSAGLWDPLLCCSTCSLAFVLILHRSCELPVLPL